MLTRIACIVAGPRYDDDGKARHIVWREMSSIAARQAASVGLRGVASR
jgi:hypothetical protein